MATTSYSFYDEFKKNLIQTKKASVPKPKPIPSQDKTPAQLLEEIEVLKQRNKEVEESLSYYVGEAARLHEEIGRLRESLRAANERPKFEDLQKNFQGLFSMLGVKTRIKVDSAQKIAECFDILWKACKKQDDDVVAE